MEAAVATATLGIWDEEGCSKSILQEWQLRSRTVFRTAFVPSQNPNPETLVLAASSDGSIATLSVFGKNKHEIISTCEDRKYPATFLALMALPFSKAVSGLYVALYWRSHVVSFGTQGLCIWLTRIPYWYKPECKNEIGTHFQWSFSTNGIGSSFGIFCFPLPSWSYRHGGHGASNVYKVFIQVTDIGVAMELLWGMPLRLSQYSLDK
ncbi:unnamed protein product [Musa acuminata subsp. malaccensis]|uniref:(wild Malaysian banana) hypothetical protein n=1 Tax=Musa acuminata subsp. malaccensis TaxID=214687 RepID=A0A8D7A2U7_MUSAM|nr:unnamed protein product [Musa acuminata subsp. malaccensis]